MGTLTIQIDDDDMAWFAKPYQISKGQIVSIKPPPP